MSSEIKRYQTKINQELTTFIRCVHSCKKKDNTAIGIQVSKYKCTHKHHNICIYTTLCSKNGMFKQK